MAEDMHIFQGRMVGSHIEIIFTLNMKTFCLSVSPFRKVAPLLSIFAQTCNALVQLVLVGTGSEWKEQPRQIRAILSAMPKAELLALCHEIPEERHLCYVQSYFYHGPRSCELQPDECGSPVLRLTGNTVDSHALDCEDQHFASLYTTTGICNVPANEMLTTSTTIISSSRICGVVCRKDKTLNLCIAARNATIRGAQRWACPERQQLIIRQALQVACASNPIDGCCIRVPELVAYIYDNDLECDSAVRWSCIMGGLYKPIDGTPLGESLDTCLGDSKMQILADQISKMMDSLHQRGFVWGGEYQGGQEAKTLLDCIVVDRRGDPWLVDGFGATYHKDVVQSDCQALASLLRQMEVDPLQSREGSVDAEGEVWIDHEILNTHTSE